MEVPISAKNLLEKEHLQSPFHYTSSKNQNNQ